MARTSPVAASSMLTITPPCLCMKTVIPASPVEPGAVSSIWPMYWMVNPKGVCGLQLANQNSPLGGHWIQ